MENKDIQSLLHAKYGIYIRGSHIVSMIMNRSKVIETRTHDKLKRFVGQWVGVIYTGSGKPKLVGYVFILSQYEFISEENFRAYEFCHRIPKGSKYDWKEGKKKYGYLLGEIVQLDSPIKLESIKGNRMWRELE